MWSWLSELKWSRLPGGRRRLGAGQQERKTGDQAADGAGVRELGDVLPRIAAEFERARRYERSVTVAVFTVAPRGGNLADTFSISGSDGRAAGDRAPSGGHLCPVVREAVRETDLVVCDPAARRCVVVMPEIGAEEGRRAVSRMRELCAARLRCPVLGDLAVFPRDGWMFPDLVEIAQRQASSADGGLTPLVPGPLGSLSPASE